MENIVKIEGMHGGEVSRYVEEKRSRVSNFQIAATSIIMTVGDHTHLNRDGGSTHRA